MKTTGSKCTYAFQSFNGKGKSTGQAYTKKIWFLSIHKNFVVYTLEVVD